MGESPPLPKLKLPKESTEDFSEPKIIPNFPESLLLPLKEL